MKTKSFLIILAIALATMTIATLINYVASSKKDVIIKENNKKITVKQYSHTLLINENLKSFDINYDSTEKNFKQKQVLYDGTIKDVNTNTSNPYVTITTKKIKKNKNKTYEIIKNNKVTDVFTMRQFKELKDNKGKRIIITKIYYPRERIFYKFPNNN